MCDKLVEIKDEQKELLERLRQVQKQKKKKTAKQKFKKINPFGEQYFSNKKKNFNVQSKIDYDYNSVKQNQKKQIYEQYKEQLELENCTFQPQLNEVSMHLVDDYRIPIYDRKPVDYSELHSSKQIQQDTTEDSYEIQKEIENAKKVPKKIDKNFYQKQMDWSRKKQNKIHQIKVQRTLNDIEKHGKPKVNKKKNKKLVSTKGNFLDRVQHNLTKKELHHKQLDKKYNNYDFKPKTNKNKTVQSKVQEQLQYIYDD